MKIMTLNIWNYNKPWLPRRDRIVSLIERYQPDVVCLQETRHDFRYERGRGQGEQLADRTGYHLTSTVTQVYIPFLRVDEGLSILSRDLPLEVRERRLTLDPHDRRDENHRKCLGILLPWADGRVGIVNTHFSLSTSARIRNAVESLGFIREWLPDDPAFLMGDLNAEPDTPPIQFLVGQSDEEGDRGDLVDCWTTANPGEVGYTYASFGPVRRIDYILGRNLSHCGLKAQVIGGDSLDGVYPSDHMGILLDVLPSSEA